MNWDAVGALGEVVGALAVVLSLVYLAAQVRQNTATIRAAAHNSLADASRDILLSLALDVGINEAFVRVVSGQEESAVDHLRMDQFYGAIFRHLENAWFQAEYGMVPRNLLENWTSNDTYMSERARLFWSANCHRFAPGFRAHFDAHLASIGQDAGSQRITDTLVDDT